MAKRGWALGAVAWAGLAVAGLALAWAGGPPIVIELRVPAGTNPTIVTDTDSSGLYKLERVTANAYRLINSDKNLGLVIIREAGRTAHELRVLNDGGCGPVPDGSNGPDPVPGTLTVGWFTNGVAQSSRDFLDAGEAAACTSCDSVHVKPE